MRITAPATDQVFDLDTLDLSQASLYIEGDAHLAWRTLRAERPVYWNDAPDGRGFWAVTRHADVRWVLRDHETFSSEGGTALDMIGLPDPAAGKMMHATDPPGHQELRRPLGTQLSTEAVGAHTAMVRSLVREALAPMERGRWDAAATLARLPAEVVVRLMDLPRQDVDVLLHAAYASVAPSDEHYRVGSVYQTLGWAHSTIVDHFTRRIRERRCALSSDLLSYVIQMSRAGRPLTEEEVVVNCYSLLVGGVVTTAQVATAMLVALAGDRGHGRYPVGAPTDQLVEEALRWASPTNHFLRHARRDVELHGVHIRKGAPVAAWIGSANRDEDVFERPYAFEPARRPNQHISFGFGPHRCVGSHLARAILSEVFAELGTKAESYEILEPPTHLASTLIAGIVRLPIRVRAR